MCLSEVKFLNNQTFFMLTSWVIHTISADSRAMNQDSGEQLNASLTSCLLALRQVVDNTCRDSW